MKRLSIAPLVTVAVLFNNHALAQEQVVIQEQKAKGEFAEVNGIRMYYEIYGKGEPPVMLHRLGASGGIALVSLRGETENNILLVTRIVRRERLNYKARYVSSSVRVTQITRTSVRRQGGRVHPRAIS